MFCLLLYTDVLQRLTDVSQVHANTVVLAWMCLLGIHATAVEVTVEQTARLVRKEIA